MLPVDQCYYFHLFLALLRPFVIFFFFGFSLGDISPWKLPRWPYYLILLLISLFLVRKMTLIKYVCIEFFFFLEIILSLPQ